MRQPTDGEERRRPFLLPVGGREKEGDLTAFSTNVKGLTGRRASKGARTKVAPFSLRRTFLESWGVARGSGSSTSWHKRDFGERRERLQGRLVD